LKATSNFCQCYYFPDLRSNRMIATVDGGVSCEYLLMYNE